MLKLVSLLGDDFDYSYMVIEGDILSEEKIGARGEIHRVHEARKYGENPVVSFLRVVRLSFESLALLIRAKPDAIVSAGPGTAVPVSIMGRLLGKRVIFIESRHVVYHKSGAGRILYHFANLFFIQWRELQILYPRAIYAGMLP